VAPIARAGVTNWKGCSVVEIRVHVVYTKANGTRTTIEGPEGGGVSLGEVVRGSIVEKLGMRHLGQTFVR